MRFSLTVMAMLILIGSAYRFGRGPERWGANLLGANLFLSILNLAIRGPSFDDVDVVLAFADTATLVGLTCMALRANRVWPLSVAALQFLVIIVHGSVLVSIGWTRVYYGMMALSQYCEMIVLAVGIACHHAREARVGRYREWRRGYTPQHLGTTAGQGLIRSLHERHSAAIHPAS